MGRRVVECLFGGVGTVRHVGVPGYGWWTEETSSYSEEPGLYINEGAASVIFPARVVESTHPSTSNVFCLRQAIVVAFMSLFVSLFAHIGPLFLPSSGCCFTAFYLV
jgi:uncharacterized membrane protein